MRLVEQLRWWASECDRTNFGCQARKLLIEAAEALEKAEPVRHGGWEKQQIAYELDNGILESVILVCSECGKPWSETPYCPNCGAKMDADN